MSTPTFATVNTPNDPTKLRHLLARLRQAAKFRVATLMAMAMFFDCSFALGPCMADDPVTLTEQDEEEESDVGATKVEASVLYLSRTDPSRAKELRERAWIETIAREVPPLKNGARQPDSDGKLPMIMWHGVGFAPLEPAEIEVLRERGLCQHLQINEAMIPAAKVLTNHGMPVILMEGRTDSWPYSLADEAGGPPGAWSHQFDLTYQPPWFEENDSSQWHGACPNQLAGWEILARQTEATMRKFKDAGVKVDAVLVDYEGDPYPWSHLFDQLKHCKRCRKELPREVVRDKEAWRNYAWQQYVQLYDRYFAAAVRRVFPDALVTNWHVVYSSSESPVRYFVRDVDLPELRPQHFTATNPIAYGSDLAWNQLWDSGQELTASAIDDFYADEIAHQVIADRANRRRAGAERVKCIPWVARACKITSGFESSIPVMSRERYRQSLANLWNHGVYSMQIFNPMHEGFEELALQELQDAVAAYDLSLAQESESR